MTKIEWTDETWNPITGCDKVSQGCKNCYAEIMHRRLMGMYPNKYSNPFLGHIQLHDDELLKPLRWNKPRMNFVNSMSDLFHPDVPISFIDKVFAVMLCTPKHTHQVLTKRPHLMAAYFSVGKDRLIERWEEATYEIGLSDKHDDPDAAACWIFNSCQDSWPIKNIWIGASCEDQKTADERIPFLAHAQVAVRFLSCEPLLEHIDLRFTSNCMSYNCADFGKCNQCIEHDHIQWVIAGGESGFRARPMHPDWIRSLRDQCKRANIPFFFKQWGEWAPHMASEATQLRSVIHNGFGQDMCRVGKSQAGNLIDGVQHMQFPNTQFLSLEKRRI